MNRNLMRILSIVTAIIALSALSLSAQPHRGKDGKDGKCDWKERVRAEKIEFITASLELTAEEAAAFWPVYNAISEEREAKMASVHRKYFALKNAVYPRKRREMKEESVNVGEAVSANGADVRKLLDEYTKAMAAVGADETKWLQRYMQVLPAEKVAKLYVAEENFRRQQIGRLGGGHGGPGPAPGKPSSDN